jgi:hypothetical protein
LEKLNGSNLRGAAFHKKQSPSAWVEKKKGRQKKQRSSSSNGSVVGPMTWGLAAFGSTATHAACQKEKEKESRYLPSGEH